MLKESLIKLIDAISERIKPCYHDWENWKCVDVTNEFGEKWAIYHLKCLKCGKLKKIRSS